MELGQFFTDMGTAITAGWLSLTAPDTSLRTNQDPGLNANIETFLKDLRQQNYRFQHCSMLDISKGILEKGTLDLSHGPIVAVPSSIGLLSNLTTLDFSHSRINSQILSSIGCLTNLKTLNLSHIKSADESMGLPEEIGCLTQLTTLNLSNSAFSSIPSSIGNLVNLRNLAISVTKNPLSIELKSLTNLSALSLYTTVNYCPEDPAGPSKEYFGLGAIQAKLHSADPYLFVEVDLFGKTRAFVESMEKLNSLKIVFQPITYNPLVNEMPSNVSFSWNSKSDFQNFLSIHHFSRVMKNASLTISFCRLFIPLKLDATLKHLYHFSERFFLLNRGFLQSKINSDKIQFRSFPKELIDGINIYLFALAVQDISMDISELIIKKAREESNNKKMNEVKELIHIQNQILKNLKDSYQLSKTMEKQVYRAGQIVSEETSRHLIPIYEALERAGVPGFSHRG